MVTGIIPEVTATLIRSTVTSVEKSGRTGLHLVEACGHHDVLKMQKWGGSFISKEIYASSAALRHGQLINSA